MRKNAFKRKMEKHIDRCYKELLELSHMIPFFDTPENYRSEREDPWPHAKRRQQENILDTGKFDFCFVGSSPT